MTNDALLDTLRDLSAILELPRRIRARVAIVLTQEEWQAARAHSDWPDISELQNDLLVQCSLDERGASRIGGVRLLVERTELVSPLSLEAKRAPDHSSTGAACATLDHER